MGRSYTPTNRLEVIDQSGKHTYSWSGRATKKRLEGFIHKLHQSYQIGGHNEHISRSLGYLPHISKAKIINQHSGEVVVDYYAPLFQVV